MAKEIFNTQAEFSTNPVTLRTRKHYSKLSDEEKQLISKRKNEALRSKLASDPEYRVEHLKRQRAATKKIRDSIPDGICKVALHCKQPQVGKSKYCLNHWLASISRSYNGRNDNRCLPMDLSVVTSLWKEQEGRCALTGVELLPGDTASIDHIVAISSGGTHEKSNLRFIHKSLNSLKGTYSESEFVALVLTLCPALIEWATTKPDVSTK